MTTIEIILAVLCFVLGLLVWRILDEVQAVRYRTNRLMEECNVSFFPKVKTPPPPEWIKERTVKLKGLKAENAKLKEELKEYYKLADNSAMQIGKLKEDLRIANRNNYYERLCEVIEGNKSLERVIEMIREENAKLKHESKADREYRSMAVASIQDKEKEIAKLKGELQKYDKYIPIYTRGGGNYAVGQEWMGRL